MRGQDSQMSESACAGGSRWADQPMKLFAATQNSLPSGSRMTVQRWRLPPIWCSPTIDPPRATNRSTAEGSGSTKSKCMRFFAVFGSGTFSKYQAGSVRSGSSPPMEANKGPLWGSSGRPRAYDQKSPTLRASSQSNVMLSTRAGKGPSLVKLPPDGQASSRMTLQGAGLLPTCSSSSLFPA
jgi:hypothetical protein